MSVTRRLLAGSAAAGLALLVVAPDAARAADGENSKNGWGTAPR